MGLRPLGHSTKWIVVASLLVCVHLLVSLLLPRSPELTAFGDLTQCILLLSAALAIVPNAIRTQGRTRLFWTLLSLGLGMWLWAQGLWTYLEVNPATGGPERPRGHGIWAARLAMLAVFSMPLMIAWSEVVGRIPQGDTVGNRIRVRFPRWGRAYVVAFAVMAGCGVARAQAPPVAQGLATSKGPLLEETQKNAAAPCVEPPPLVSLEAYDGPLKKTVGIFARKLERKSVRPRYKPGAILCSLELKDKFVLFALDSTDPVSFLDSGLNAGFAQAQDDDPMFGQGAAGYGRRFGASFTDQASSKFFTDFVFPTIFSEDPRYYRLGSGSGRSRFLHAVEHVFGRTPR